MAICTVFSLDKKYNNMMEEIIKEKYGCTRCYYENKKCNGSTCRLGIEHYYKNRKTS